MLAFKLALRNLIGAGLRTWLNVFILSLSFVVIIWYNGLIAGWNQQARLDMIDWEIGGGQYWHQKYDPYDPFSLTDGHGPLPQELQMKVDQDQLTPVLITQATIYPQGRLRSILLKGIEPRQNILSLPGNLLDQQIDEIPAIIGTRMAANSKLNIDDLVTVRWRDANGVFDADEIKIVGIYKTNVPAVDNGQIWIPLDRLRALMQLPGEATIAVLAKTVKMDQPVKGWIFKAPDILLAELEKIIRSKTIGASILYLILLALALLAIFDTQVLSIFHRQKEIGTDMALGMTRGQVIRLFTVEGAMHAVLASILAAAYGIPLLSWQAVRGISFPAATDSYGLAIAERIFPVYSFALIISTILLVLVTTTVVSYLPARKITHMKPTEAIRGKIQ